MSMSNENRFLVLGASKYNFEQNGQTIKGSKVRYIPNENPSDDNSFGIKVIELNMDYDKAELFRNGTGIYDLGFSIVPGARGSAKLVVNTAKFVKKIDLNSLLA